MHFCTFTESLLHNITGGICASIPCYGTDHNIAETPTLSKRITNEIIIVLGATFVGSQIVESESKNNCVIMRAISSRAILAASEEPNTLIRMFLSQTFHKKLKITSTKSKSGTSFTVIILRIVRHRHMVIIVSQSYKVRRIMILKLQHTAISPLTGTLKPTADTTTTGNLQTSIGRIRLPFSRTRHEFNVAFTINIKASRDGQHGMETRHKAHLTKEIQYPLIFIVVL
nr:hypothetical protein GUZLRYQV_GUZLRYQV_CDS_0009 [Microvirus sp.]